MSCLLFILSRVQNFSLGTFLFWYPLLRKTYFACCCEGSLGNCGSASNCVGSSFDLTLINTTFGAVHKKKLFSENWETCQWGLFFMEILLIYSEITKQRMFTGSSVLHTRRAGCAGVPRRFTKLCSQSRKRFSSRCSTRQTLLKQAHHCGGLQIEWQHENWSDRTVLFSQRTLIQDCLKACECQVHCS